jgi:hypothetical protein
MCSKDYCEFLQSGAQKKKETCHQPSTAAPSCTELLLAPEMVVGDLVQTDLRQVGLVFDGAELLKVWHTYVICK